MKVPHTSKSKIVKGTRGVISIPEEDENIKPGWRKGIVKRRKKDALDEKKLKQEVSRKTKQEVTKED